MLRQTHGSAASQTTHVARVPNLAPSSFMYRAHVRHQIDTGDEGFPALVTHVILHSIGLVPACHMQAETVAPAEPLAAL